jgi:predicted site-specific integrase-resolvase
MQDLITPEQAAERLSVSISRLTLWRTEGKGPAYVRISESPTGRIRYRPEDIDAYIEQRRTNPDRG